MYLPWSRKHKRTYSSAFIEKNLSGNEINSWKKLYGQYYDDIKVVIVMTILSCLCEQGPDGLTKHEVIRDDDAECIRDIWSVVITTENFSEMCKFVRKFPDGFRSVGINITPDELEDVLEEFIDRSTAIEGEIITLHEGRTDQDFALKLLPTEEGKVLISGYTKGLRSYLTISI